MIYHWTYSKDYLLIPDFAWKKHPIAKFLPIFNDRKRELEKKNIKS